MTKQEAIEKAETGWWQTATPDEIVRFQLYENLLCMDFGAFHRAVETVLGRPVYTHEFAAPKALQLEYEGVVGSPSFTDILEMLPKGKPIVIIHSDGDDHADQ